MSDLQSLETAKADNLAAVKILIESGGDINQQDEYGWTALNREAGKGDFETVKLLLDNGADVFNVGRDQRTPYMIALAAGHVGVARLLREAEEKTGDKRISQPDRLYCAAYHLQDLRKFPGWTEDDSKAKEPKVNGNDPEQGLLDEDIVFLHQDFTVTKSMWRNEAVIFDKVGQEWVEFCTSTLEFIVPDDLDLVPPLSAASNTKPS